MRFGVDTPLRVDMQAVIFAPMQRTAFRPPSRAPETDLGSAFNVVIAYEDFETGKLAKKTYDFLATHLGQECRFSNQMWKFDILTLPKLREMAAKDVCLADIVIISCRGEELPEPVKEWIELWSGPERQTPLALVALFENGSGNVFQMREVRDYLAQVAKRAGMEFFAQPEELSIRNEMLDSAFEQPLLPRGKTLSTLAGLVRDQGAPRWGINE